MQNSKIEDTKTINDIFVQSLPTEEDRNFILTKDSIEKLVHLKKPNVIDLLGYNYSIEDYRDGAVAYYYNKYIILFDYDDKIELIDCGDFNYNGYEISVGMTFKDRKSVV